MDFEVHLLDKGGGQRKVVFGEVDPNGVGLFISFFVLVLG